jgi:hypothetical protein
VTEIVEMIKEETNFFWPQGISVGIRLDDQFVYLGMEQAIEGTVTNEGIWFWASFRILTASGVEKVTAQTAQYWKYSTQNKHASLLERVFQKFKKTSALTAGFEIAPVEFEERVSDTKVEVWLKRGIQKQV